MAFTHASMGSLQNAHRRLLSSQLHCSRPLLWRTNKSVPCLSRRHLHDEQVKEQGPQGELELSNEVPVKRDEQAKEDAERRPGQSSSEESAFDPQFWSGLSRESIEEFKKSFDFQRQQRKVWDNCVEGRAVKFHGFLSNRRVMSSKLVFADIATEGCPSVQVTAKFDTEDGPSTKVLANLRAIPLNSPVSVTGKVTFAKHVQFRNPFEKNLQRLELDLIKVQSLNRFPKDIIVTQDVQFPPESRHLQIRFSDRLRSRLMFRHAVNAKLRRTLDGHGFQEYETPILFKSTREGAREFLVPTRRKGKFYALPQSPQQYKQILMASGVQAYYQFARCFRDEDLRADRQPEFTQLDLEMAFAKGSDVRSVVEQTLGKLLGYLNRNFALLDQGGSLAPIRLDDLQEEDKSKAKKWPQFLGTIPHMSYEDAMTRFGIDKPDLRIPFEMMRIDEFLPEDFVKMITDLDSPIVETFRLRPDPEVYSGAPADVSATFRELMARIPKEVASSPYGAPVMLAVDSSKPLRGLSSLGHEGVARLSEAAAGEESPLGDLDDLQDGDVLFIQARRNEPFRSGSTVLGNLRNLVYAEAVNKGLLKRDLSFRFLWVTEFPMFTPDEDENGAVGQRGTRGFSATHHPFTAPLTKKDFELMTTDPLRAKADHYDLVLNGVELGGGSRRIHIAEVQQFVFKQILGMPDSGIAEFSHLLEALRAGCPPHAGFALGFDRLVAILSGTESVRDVIAFPKSMKGVDLMVKSPSTPTEQRLKEYHIRDTK